MRQNNESNLRLGFSKIDFNAEEMAADFRERRSQMLSGEMRDTELEEKMMEFQDINTYIHQYRAKLGCDQTKDQTTVDRLFGVKHGDDEL